jgi:hypothetical protein
MLKQLQKKYLGISMVTQVPGSQSSTSMEQSTPNGTTATTQHRKSDQTALQDLYVPGRCPSRIYQLPRRPTSAKSNHLQQDTIIWVQARAQNPHLRQRCCSLRWVLCAVQRAARCGRQDQHCGEHRGHHSQIAARWPANHDLPLAQVAVFEQVPPSNSDSR